MKIFLSIFISLVAIYGYWYISGINLEYVKNNAITSVRKVCDDEKTSIYEGYKRSIFGGFGGKVFYLCEIDGIKVEFYTARRIDNPELQIYNIAPIFNFTENLNIK